MIQDAGTAVMNSTVGVYRMPAFAGMTIVNVTASLSAGRW